MSSPPDIVKFELRNLSDNTLYFPTDEQVSLYAYRCLCKEYFEVENSVATFTALCDRPNLDTETGFDLRAPLDERQQSFLNMIWHKEKYDISLTTKNYDDFEYLSFTSSSPWNLQVSGVMSPDFDFCGKKIKSTDHAIHGSLITFYTAPTDTGWAFNFTWHKSSSKACRELLTSLKRAHLIDQSIADSLFRFAFLCSENLVFRISWWDNLSNGTKSEILDPIARMVQSHGQVPRNYLAFGMEDISGWEFEKSYYNSKPRV